MLTTNLKLLMIKYFTYNTIHNLCQISSICKNRDLWLTLLSTYGDNNQPTTMEDARQRYLDRIIYENYMDYSHSQQRKIDIINKVDSQYKHEVESLKRQHNNNINQINNSYNNYNIRLFTSRDQILRDLISKYGYEHLDPIAKNDIDQTFVVISKNNNGFNRKSVLSILDHKTTIIATTNDKIILHLYDVDINYIQDLFNKYDTNAKIISYIDYLEQDL